MISKYSVLLKKKIFLNHSSRLIIASFPINLKLSLISTFFLNKKLFAIKADNKKASSDSQSIQNFIFLLTTYT